MKNLLVVIFFVLISMDVRADALLFHVGSQHSGEPDESMDSDCKPYNEFNPGLGYIYDADPETGLRYEFGFFENSCRHTSLYAGFNLAITDDGRWSALVGLANGWPQEEGEDNAVPEIIGQARYTHLTGYGVNPVVGLGVDHDFESLITFSLERRW